MQNELRYNVRSREIVDLVAAMKNTALTLNPYFQRNLVWRDAHRRDFIDTILKGVSISSNISCSGAVGRR